MYGALTGYGSNVRPPNDTAELTHLTGLPFADSDDVIAAAIAEASVPALVMSVAA